MFSLCSNICNGFKYLTTLQCVTRIKRVILYLRGDVKCCLHLLKSPRGQDSKWKRTNCLSKVPKIINQWLNRKKMIVYSLTCRRICYNCAIVMGFTMSITHHGSNLLTQIKHYIMILSGLFIFLKKLCSWKAISSQWRLLENY